MKRLLLNFMLLTAVLGFSLTSCEKTDDLNDNADPVELSEFILGADWSTPVEEFGSGIIMLIEFINDGTYAITLTDGTEEYPFPSAAYWINNETSVLTMDQPELSLGKKTIAVDQGIFKVTWQEKINTTMTWSEEGEDDIIWTRP